MLTRRNFSACAICAVAGFAATAIGDAQAQTPGIKRTILQKMEFPDNYVTITALVEIDPSAAVGIPIRASKPSMCWTASSSLR